MLPLFFAALSMVTPQEPLHIFLRGGPKTHGPGQHEHELWVREWSGLLRQRGAIVEGAVRFPTREELSRTDVLVMYAADAGSIHGEERRNLESYLERGGGIVAIHDAVCGDDPQWWKGVIGGAWEHGHAKWHEGTTDLYFTDREHPITADAGNFRFNDELYTDLHLDPAARVLARGFHSVFDASPQTWIFEKGNYRAFVSIQGHEWTSFSHPGWRALLLRGIAWSGRRDVDLLVSPEERVSVRYPPGGPIEPSKAAAELELHEQFALSLAAAEPLVVKPISIDWDPRGRMWVAETVSYPEKSKFSGKAPADMISILTDGDGDGRMDRKQVFFEGLDLVTSLVFHKDGVIVAQAPEILLLRDTDGNDACDERVVLYSGFGYGDTHATFSNMRWGLDGWIYATQGYSGGGSRNIRNAAGKDFGHIGNGLFRFRPDGSAIEMVSNYGSNTWGLDFSDEEELFFTMANGAHLRHVVVPERVFADGRMGDVESWADCPDHDRVEPILTHKDPAYAQIDFVGGFTAASGGLLYTGGAWPAKEWRNAHFVAEPTVHIVHHDVLARDGVTFKAAKARNPEFLAGRDLWFRPVHMRVGPDGAMYVLDFYNQAIVHNDTRGPEHGPTNAAKRPDRDHMHGRIWRVQHKQAERDLGVGLASANSVIRGNALRLLAETSGESARKEARQALESGAMTARLAGAWLLARTGGLEPADFKRIFSDKEPAVRAAAARIAGETGSADQAVRRELLAQLDAREPQVRLQALVALGDLGADEASANSIAAHWSRFEDRWSKNAALRIAGRSPLESFRALVASAGADSGSLGTELARRAARRKDAAAAAGIVQAIAQTAGLNATVSAPVIDVLARDLPAASRPKIEGELAEAITRLLGDPQIETAAAAMRLVSAWDSTGVLRNRTGELGERLSRMLDDEAMNREARRFALSTLLTIPERRVAAVGSASRLFSPTAPLQDQVALVDALGASDCVEAAQALIRAYPQASGQVQDRIFGRLIARSSGAEALLRAIDTNQLDARALGTQKMHRLRTHPDANIAAQAKAVLERAGAGASQAQVLIARLLPEVDQPGGDPVHGKQLFEANCAACHMVNGKGGKVGPDITGMGAHGAKDLLPVILDPNRAVEEAYTEWTCQTVDEELFAGVLARESADSILLRWNGGEKEIARSEIAVLRNTGRSPMPAGFESLGAKGLRDLIAFLASGTEGFRLLDLSAAVTRNSLDGIYDRRQSGEILKPQKFGMDTVFEVPFELLDPARTSSGNNVIVLKGGTAGDWECKRLAPQSVEVPVGFEVQAVHILGGIAAWGHPFHRAKTEILKWVWNYADGSTEEHVMHNGVEFGDWISRNDVPGSKYVEGFLAPDSWGQVRFHSVIPSRKAVVRSITLSSYDNLFAPTIVALTAELPGAPTRAFVAAPEGPRQVRPADVLILGGGSSHDFRRWFGEADLGTLRAADFTSTLFTEDVDEFEAQLPLAKLLILTNNQPIEKPELRRRISEHVAQGSGLFVVHPATWFNWTDWPEFNAQLVGGGARSHEDYGEFEVRALAPRHELLKGVDHPFRIRDELYRVELDPAGKSEVLLQGYSLSSGRDYPVLWLRTLGKGRIVGLSLGHDGAAHEHRAYQTLYTNIVRWLLPR
jgi:putative membrane-bound dehydrogenase-like protein